MEIERKTSIIDGNSITAKRYLKRLFRHSRKTPNYAGPEKETDPLKVFANTEDAIIKAIAVFSSVRRTPNDVGLHDRDRTH